MNKRFIVVVAVVAALGCSTAMVMLWYAHTYDDAHITEKDILQARQRLGFSEPKAETPVPSLPASKTVRLAVGSLGLGDDAENRELADLVTAELSGAAALEMVERQSLDRVLAELEMSLSSLVRAKDAVAAGKLLRADWFLLGTKAVVAGTNSVVVRVVDARTGILRDACAFGWRNTPARLASDIAVFARESRKRASSGEQAVYLAIGPFQDVGVNSRQAGFPQQLRGYLTAAFRAGPLTMLEREYVETLLREVHLDMAGLTADSSAPATPMQSAFWMVSGSYQSYETTNYVIQTDLEVNRIFGVNKRVAVTGEPGEKICENIKHAIEQVVNQNSGRIIPSRKTEVRLQMSTGLELASAEAPLKNPDYLISGGTSSFVFDPERTARRKRNLEEALRAFETVLLLEPTNRQARFFAAACLVNQTIQRVDEARQYYRELLEAPLQDVWAGKARQGLVESFERNELEPKAVWFDSAAGNTSSSNAAAFYKQQAEAARAELLLKSTGPKAQALAEERLWNNMTNALLGSVAGPTGVEEFVKTFGTDHGAAAEALAKLYPNLKGRALPLAPYLLAAVVAAQVDTNAPLVAEFRQLLEHLKQHPEAVFDPGTFWPHVESAVWKWSWRQKDYRLAAAFLEAKVAASVVFTPATSYTNHTRPVEISDRDRIRLGFAHLRTEEWEKALREFESFSGQPISLFEEAWGDGVTFVSTRRQANLCRRKLGLPVPAGLPELELGKPVMQLCRDQTFIASGEGLWIPFENSVLQVDFALHTNFVVKVPMDQPVTALCVTSSNLWVGTDGAGLYEFDKATRQFQHLTHEQGLLLDSIASFCLSGESLWIGYGRKVREAELKSDGGLGVFDLRTRRVRSLGVSLPDGQAGANLATRAAVGQPPRSTVLALKEGAAGEIWFIAESPVPWLGRYRAAENAWDVDLQGCTSIVSDSKHLFAGQNLNYFGENKSGTLGVGMRELNDRTAKWQEFKRPEGLPPARVTALALDGAILWAGGFGYLAQLDTTAGQVIGIAYPETEAVDQIQVGGGYVWAQWNCCLYRYRYGL